MRDLICNEVKQEEHALFYLCPFPFHASLHFISLIVKEKKAKEMKITHSFRSFHLPPYLFLSSWFGWWCSFHLIISEVKQAHELNEKKQHHQQHSRILE